MQYDRDYYEGNRSNYESPKEMMVNAEQKYFPKLQKSFKLNKISDVLDIGCAYGYFLKLCDELGCSTYGLDISEYAIEQAKKQTNAKLYVYDVNAGLPIFQDSVFDLVTMFDVAEHLNAPFFLLKEIYRVLKPKGMLAITTPNQNALERLFQKLLRKEKSWHGFRDRTHRSIFTQVSIRFLIEKAGFRVLEIETPFHLFPRRLQKLMNRTGLGGQIWLLAEKLENRLDLHCEGMSECSGKKKQRIGQLDRKGSFVSPL